MHGAAEDGRPAATSRFWYWNQGTKDVERCSDHSRREHLKNERLSALPKRVVCGEQLLRWETKHETLSCSVPQVAAVSKEKLLVDIRQKTEEEATTKRSEAHAMLPEEVPVNTDVAQICLTAMLELEKAKIDHNNMTEDVNANHHRRIEQVRLHMCVCESVCMHAIAHTWTYMLRCWHVARQTKTLCSSACVHPSAWHSKWPMSAAANLASSQISLRAEPWKAPT